MISLTCDQLIEFLQGHSPDKEVKLLGIVLALADEDGSLESEELTEDGRPKTLGIQVSENIKIKDLVR